jgi:uncharacterized protein YceK
MKTLVLSFFVMLALQGCSGEGFYHLDSEEKAKQKGYHANEANRLIDANEKNKKANQQAAEKNRVAANEQAKAHSRSKKGASNDRTFKFY